MIHPQVSMEDGTISPCLGCFSSAGGRPSASGVRPEGLPCHGQSCSSPKAWIYLDVLVYLVIIMVYPGLTPTTKTWIYLVIPHKNLDIPGYTWLIQRNLGIPGNQKQRLRQAPHCLPPARSWRDQRDHPRSQLVHPRSSGLIPWFFQQISHIPSGNLTYLYKMAIYSGFTH